MEIHKRDYNELGESDFSQNQEFGGKKKICSKSINKQPHMDQQFDAECFFDDCSFDFFDPKVNIENKQPNFQGTARAVEPNFWYRFYISRFERDSKNFDLKVILVKEENSDIRILCRLQSQWCQTKLRENDIVSLYAIWNNDCQSYLVNNFEGFLITNPDFLISGTTVVGSLFCQRKAVLQEKFRGIDANKEIMVIGTLVHELMQSVLQKKIFIKNQIEDLAEEMLNSKEIIYTLYSSKMSLLETKSEIKKFIPQIVKFVDKYLLQTTKVNKEEFGEIIEEIQDIEENIWLPQLGLKGKIDITVKVHSSKSEILRSESKKKILPLEIKTGRSSFSLEHKGQVILYQMMLNEIGFKTDSGLLLYLRDDIMKEIKVTRNEQRDLIILRNEISYYLTKTMKLEDDKLKFQTMALPEPIYHSNACSKCPYSTLCTTFLKTDKSYKLTENHPLTAISKNVSEYLKPNHIDYFMFWCGIITLEQEENHKSSNIKSLWIDLPEKRMKERKSLISLYLLEPVSFNASRYVHKFAFAENGKGPINFNSLEKNYLVGDYVLISTNKRICIASGTVKEVAPTFITVSLERNLLKNYVTEKFIIDKYESKSGNVFNFTSIGLLLENSDRMLFLRNIIIDKISPSFAKKLPTILVLKGRSTLEELNSVQQCAVLKALSTDSYMLIKGLPGTGKTQTIVAIICLLNLLNKSVIITSHTHSAVDNVLLRLKDKKIPFLRLGPDNRVHPELKMYSETFHIKNCKNPEELEELYNSFSIVGITCLGTNHAVFKNKKDFDFCIVDEATQVFQPTVIRSLLLSKKFVLVGDPDQLPPLIRSKKAREIGAEESLFHRLDLSNATTTLTLQYRMNKVITKLANDITYAKKLQCGNDRTMNSVLEFPNYSLLLEKYAKEKWILKAIEKHIDQSVIFLNTEDCHERSLKILNSLENKFKKKFTESNEDWLNFEATKQIQLKCVNFCEVSIVFTLIKALIYGGIFCKNIGVIAPYRAQVELLKHILIEYTRKSNYSDMKSLEINTVDQFQGRDKDIIIYSCSKTGKSLENIKSILKGNEILEDQRRLTVAITRSKQKLIIIGDENCLISYTPFNNLLNKIPKRCKYKLEDDVLGFSWNDIIEQTKLSC